MAEAVGVVTNWGKAATMIDHIHDQWYRSEIDRAIGQYRRGLITSAELASYFLDKTAYLARQLADESACYTLAHLIEMTGPKLPSKVIQQIKVILKEQDAGFTRSFHIGGPPQTEEQKKRHHERDRRAFLLSAEALQEFFKKEESQA